jgi:hypothetical protein
MGWALRSVKTAEQGSTSTATGNKPANHVVPDNFNLELEDHRALVNANVAIFARQGQPMENGNNVGQINIVPQEPLLKTPLVLKCKALQSVPIPPVSVASKRVQTVLPVKMV